MKGKEAPKVEADHSRLEAAAVISKGTCIGGLPWVTTGSEVLCTQRQNPEVCIEAPAGFSHCPDGLNTLLSQGWALENDSHCGNSGQKSHSKDRRGHEVPRMAWVQPEGRLAVTSS